MPSRPPATGGYDAWLGASGALPYPAQSGRATAAPAWPMRSPRRRRRNNPRPPETISAYLSRARAPPMCSAQRLFAVPSRNRFDGRYPIFSRPRNPPDGVLAERAFWREAPDGAYPPTHRNALKLGDRPNFTTATGWVGGGGGAVVSGKGPSGGRRYFQKRLPIWVAFHISGRARGRKGGPIDEPPPPLSGAQMNNGVAVSTPQIEVYMGAGPVGRPLSAAGLRGALFKRE